jgi:hypothetical protein
MIIALAEKDHCPLYEAWQHLMQIRFHVREAENRQVVDLTKDREVIDLTSEIKNDQLAAEVPTLGIDRNNLTISLARFLHEKSLEVNEHNDEWC